MRNKIEIYNYSRRIETILERIRNSEIDKKNKDAEFFRKTLLEIMAQEAEELHLSYTIT